VKRRRSMCAILVLSACAVAPDNPAAAPAEPVTVQLAASSGPAAVAATPPARSPQPAPEKAVVHLPKSTDFRLANGMRVFLVPRNDVPLVAFEVRLAGGTVEDPAGKEGTTALLASLLTKGAGQRDAKAFHEAVEFVGGTFSAGAARRWTTVECEFLKKDTDLALELLGDVLMHPRLDAAEFDTERGLSLDELSQAREQPLQVLPMYWGAHLFTGHPFARPVGGDETSLAKITVDDVKARAAQTLGPSRVWMAVAGAFEPGEMRKKIEARFGAWDAKTPDVVPVPKFAGPKTPGVLLIDMPTSLQTYFRFGNMGIDWSHPDYPARTVANAMLGERFTSRLNQSLRIDSGLTYGAGSGFDDASQGAFSVRTFTAVDTSERAMDMAADLYAKFVKDGITQEELDGTRRYIQGQFATGTVQTADQAASMILSLEFDGLSRDVVDRYFERLDALTLDEVNRVIRERFPSKQLTWVVIGPAAKLEPIVKKFGPVTQVKLADPGFGPQ
jgi:zinc protease